MRTLAPLAWAEWRHHPWRTAAALLAIVHRPPLILADEPTGNLDPRTSEHVFNALTQLIQASRLAAIVATHNMEIAARMDRRVTIKDGLVIELD